MPKHMTNIQTATDKENIMKFEIGKTYTTGESRDYVWHFTVIARTEHFITFTDAAREAVAAKRIKVSNIDGIESARPFGRGMIGMIVCAPTLSADTAA